ncbi:uncharacterized protein SPSK_01299 [Sporothrix schenckii 1099-18]|uniref:Uncharacterized protein n=1 Tax=Sporothrix schenckii 1099-18 TaxID=1397361 RepID=A0A0F2LVR1_SPOSC|nr:uncharacterized protein SPSK_01299 [Sporothrix schenckii 1099-18]KJR81538.1 hypothetical protein SPSK_01299 [Sporothrix schenckii 1099-18]
MVRNTFLVNRSGTTQKEFCELKIGKMNAVFGTRAFTGNNASPAPAVNIQSVAPPFLEYSAMHLFFRIREERTGNLQLRKVQHNDKRVAFENERCREEEHAPSCVTT